MALTSCRECAGQISDTAPQCPHCGAVPTKEPSPPSFFKAIGLIFVFLIAFKACSESPSPKKTAPPDPVAEAKFQRVVKALSALKASLRDPSSFELSSAAASDDASVICIEYRAKNGFGGTNFQQVVFSSSGVSSKTIDWNKNCTGRPMVDMTFAKHALP